jgi:DNA primase
MAFFHAKKAIRDQDNCYLVEGYADVLSVHQAHIENVVASSGTSLTIEQIRLIGRFTQNVTILYDGDAAGIKASLRGLDMILEEGLNVKVVSFPAGDDPDSYMHKVGAGAFKSYIEDNRKDFILYKANILLADAGNDPIKRAGIIRDIVESIAKIPDNIKAAVFIRECSSLLAIEERVLLSELNTMRAAKLKKSSPLSRQQPAQQGMPPDNLFDDNRREDDGPIVEIPESGEDKEQEMEILRLLLAYGHELVNWDETENMYIGSFIMQNLSDVVFKNGLLDRIIKHYWDKVEKGQLPTINSFIHSEDKDISNVSVDVSTSQYELSPNWENKHNIYVRHESMHLKKTILDGIYYLKKRKIDQIKKDVAIQLKTEKDPVNVEIILNKYMLIKRVEMTIAAYLGNVILE